MKTIPEMMTDLEAIGMPAMPPIHPRFGVPMIGPEWVANYLKWAQEEWFAPGSRGYFGA